MLKQFIKPVLCSWVFTLGVVVLTTSALSHYAFAQLPPPVSPWLGMTDRNSRNTGPLGPYLSNVKPLQDQMRTSSVLQNQLQSQQQALRTLQDGGAFLGGYSGGSGAGGGHAGSDVKSVLNPPREIPSAQLPAGYFQYIHYYPPNSLPRRQVPYYSPVR